jgi:hypothetical protein
VRESKGYLGLDLAGAKNERTALASIEFYPKERKIFLLDIYDRIVPKDDQTSDEALLEILNELKGGVAKLGVNVPLSLPPCVTCTRSHCPMPTHCTVPAVKYMRNLVKKASKSSTLRDRVRPFTPYTQRPIELFTRYQLLPNLKGPGFEIDEALGGNKAPLTMRMGFLRRHLKDLTLVEVWPKYSVLALAGQAGVQKRLLSSYRHLEEGLQARTEILEALAEAGDIFIYDRDLKKLAHSLASFDAFICAYTALLSDQDLCEKIPAGYPASSGWSEFPKITD